MLPPRRRQPPVRARHWVVVGTWKLPGLASVATVKAASWAGGVRVRAVVAVPRKPVGQSSGMFIVFGSAVRGR